MKNEFEKLDQFMMKNRPDIAKMALKRPPGFQRFPWMGYAVAFGLSVIVTVGVVRQHRAEADSAVALSEVLSWDVTKDELPAEMELELAMLE